MNMDWYGKMNLINTLDNSKWTHETGDGSQYGLWGWGNGELQYYKQENTTLADGFATITVKEDQLEITITLPLG